MNKTRGQKSHAAAPLRQLHLKILSLENQLHSFNWETDHWGSFNSFNQRASRWSDTVILAVSAWESIIGATV
jgi:hypothetical protein